MRARQGGLEHLMLIRESTDNVNIICRACQGRIPAGETMYVFMFDNNPGGTGPAEHLSHTCEVRNMRKGGDWCDNKAIVRWKTPDGVTLLCNGHALNQANYYARTNDGFMPSSERFDRILSLMAGFEGQRYLASKKGI